MNPTATLRALKGAPASVLLALLLQRDRPVGCQRLATITGYSGKPIAAALHVLADLGLAQNHSRRNGWTATAHLRQTILGELPPETENLRLAGSSSSCYIEGDRFSLGTTTTTTRETENLRLNPPWRKLLDFLVADCTTPRRTADRLVHSLSTAGRDPRVEYLAALRWLSYCHSDHGAGIDYPGAFIPAKLEYNEPCPAWYSPSYDCPLWRRIERLASKLEPDA